MHTISIFVDKKRMPKPASYFECQTHLAKNLRNATNFIIRNLRTGLKKALDAPPMRMRSWRRYASVLRWQTKSFRKMLTDSQGMFDRFERIDVLKTVEQKLKHWADSQKDCGMEINII